MHTIHHTIAAALCCGILFLAGGCGEEDAIPDSEVVAQYKEEKLTYKELGEYLPDGVSPEDSARFAKQRVAAWVRMQAIADDALRRDPTLNERIEYKVRDYKAKLIVEEFHRLLIEDSLNVSVTPAEIESYYEEHKSSFVSKENLYSYFYVVTAETRTSEQSALIRSDDPAEIAELLRWAESNALEYKLDSSFVGETEIGQVSKGYFGNLKKADVGKLIRWNGVIQREQRRYLFKMLAVVNESDPLPLSLCREKIRDLIINERKNALIKRAEDRILKDARTNNFILKE